MLQDKNAAMVDEMGKLGVIQRSSSVWSSPVVLVANRDDSYRFCIDYRKLNSVTKKDVYQLPRIDDILDTSSGARFFSTLALAAGYWQIALDPETASKAAFITYHGLHECVRMTLGIACPSNISMSHESGFSRLTLEELFCVYQQCVSVLTDL